MTRIRFTKHTHYEQNLIRGGDIRFDFNDLGSSSQRLT
jgi:hypothetical protein